MTYSNGWGHLIMSLAVLIFSGVLLVLRVADATTVIGLVSTVVAFWFLSGARFQVPIVPTPVQTPAPTPAPAPADQVKIP